MPVCPQCGAKVPEGAAICSNCGTELNQTKSSSIPQPQPTTNEPNAWPNESGADLQTRLEKAMRRTELLTYAAMGLGAALLAVIIIISLL